MRYQRCQENHWVLCGLWSILPNSSDLIFPTLISQKAALGRPFLMSNSPPSGGFSLESNSPLSSGELSQNIFECVQRFVNFSSGVVVHGADAHHAAGLQQP